MSSLDKYSIALFLAASLILLIGGLFFLDFIMPFVSSRLSWQLWSFWLIGGLYFGLLILLLGFASMFAFGTERVNWRMTIIGSIIGLTLSVLYISVLAFLLSKLLPSGFEPFRSVTLPILLWAFTIYSISRTRVGQWLRRVSEAKR